MNCKIIAFATVVLLAVMPLSGCGKQDSTSLSSGSSEQSSVPEPITSDTLDESSEASEPSSDAPHTHEYTETVIAPTCTEDGYTLHKCSCGKAYKDNIVAKKGHTFGEWSVTKQATTAVEGQKQRTCTVCGAKETEKIAKLAVSFDPSAEQAEVLRLVNAERAKAGLSALSYRSDIQPAADIRANEITQKFAHTRPDGSACFTVLNEVSKHYVGENIAAGQQNSATVMTDWMNSELHRGNILNERFTGLAVGITEKDGVKYWVQLFVG